MDRMLKMKAGKALDITFQTFGLKVADIAQKSDVPANEIYRFKNGKRESIGSEKLMAIVRALPVYAQLYFLHLCTDNIQEKELLQVQH
jgi:transcriptional regulator with XRE-family HTH domain